MNPTLKKWLPWIAVAAVALIVIIIIAVNSGGEDVAATTTTSGETTTTVPETTTTTEETTTTTEGVQFEPVPMNLGSILPQTGGLAAIIDALEQPVRMAAEEINAVSDGLVTVTYADSATDPATASTNIDEFLTGSYNAIIGPAATTVTLGVFDKVNESQLTMCSG